MELKEKSKKYQRILRKDHKVEEKIRRNNPDLKSIRDLPKIGAFVVFDETDDKIECLRQYKRFRFLCSLCVPKRYRLNHRHLKVRNAADPSNIIWENLEVNFLESFVRSLIVFVIVIFLLTISFLAIYAIRVYQGNNNFDTCTPAYKLLTIDTVNKSNTEELECFCYY